MYVIPRSKINFCEGDGPDHPYCQHKGVCWMMTRHRSRRYGCRACPNKPENLGIVVDANVIQRGKEATEPPKYVLPPKVEPLKGPIRIQTGAQEHWRIRVPNGKDS